MGSRGNPKWVKSPDTTTDIGTTMEVGTLSQGRAQEYGKASLGSDVEEVCRKCKLLSSEYLHVRDKTGGICHKKSPTPKANSLRLSQCHHLMLLLLRELTELCGWLSDTFLKTCKNK